MDNYFENQSEFVKWINWRRSLTNSWSQESLAKLIGVTRQTISNLFKGKKKPTPSEVIALAYALNDVEHIPELLEMTGHGDILKNVDERRRILGIVEANPSWFYDDDKPYDWWEYYYRRRELM